jgi:WhiB family redox-sensing transcriptional regulator
MTPSDDELDVMARQTAIKLGRLIDAELGGFLPVKDWRAEALCDETGDWITLPQHMGIKKMRAAKAYELAVCDSCTVSRQCLDYALTQGEWFGIFGGKVPGERRAIKKATTEPRCGTQAGFSAHRRRREPPCHDCRRAFNNAQAQRKRRRKATQ